MCCCGFTLDYFDAFVTTLCQNRIFETAHMYQIKQQATCSVDESRSIDMKMYPILVGRAKLPPYPDELQGCDMFAHCTKTTALRRREVHKDSVEPLEADMVGERPRWWGLIV